MICWGSSWKCGQGTCGSPFAHKILRSPLFFPSDKKVPVFIINVSKFTCQEYYHLTRQQFTALQHSFPRYYDFFKGYNKMDSVFKEHRTIKWWVFPIEIYIIKVVTPGYKNIHVIFIVKKLKCLKTASSLFLSRRCFATKMVKITYETYW